jgi:hypothetical protein
MNPVVVGPCTVETLTAANLSPSVSEQAGTINISGGLAPVALQLNANRQYVWTANAALWNGGETLTASSTGGVVPAFSQTVVAPGAVNVTSPACDGSSCGTIDCAQDLPVSWTGTSGLHLRFRSVSHSPSAERYVDCSFTSSPGVVPAAALGMVFRSNGLASPEVLIDSFNATTFSAGDYDITLRASARQPGGFFATVN